MSEDTNPQVEPNQEPQDTTDDIEQSSDIEKIITEKVSIALESHKKEIAGLNRRNSELEKALKEKEDHEKELELKSLDEKERSKRELELAKEEKKKIEEETQKLKIERIIDKSLFDVGLPQEFAKHINGETEEEIKDDISGLNEFINKQVEDRIEKEINKRLSGNKPIGNDKPVDVNNLQSAYDKAKENNNGPLKIAILRKAKEEGIDIKQ
jgi:hypothetical protein